VIYLLFLYNPVDFADYLYKTQDFRRAALEYERIGFLSLSDTLLASYCLLKAGEALLKTGEPSRAARIYLFGIRNIPAFWEKFTYGLLRARFAQEDFYAVDSLAELLQNTDLKWHATIYRSFSLALKGDLDKAKKYLSLLKKTPLRDSALMLFTKPLKSRNPFLSAGLSFILPGAGQAYCGRWADAGQSFLITFLMGGSALYYLFFDTTKGSTPKGVITGTLAALFWLGNIYGAFNSALDYNDYENRKKEEELRNLLECFDLEPEIKRP